VRSGKPKGRSPSKPAFCGEGATGAPLTPSGQGFLHFGDEFQALLGPKKIRSLSQNWLTLIPVLAIAFLIRLSEARSCALVNGHGFNLTPHPSSSLRADTLESGSHFGRSFCVSAQKLFTFCKSSRLVLR
jgi:hypothetical protein